ncbi:MAG: hypothetical protein J6T15_03745 [Bacilli bacterium]|nr:hypothetical protein [Bacilli bacterium]
MKKAIKQLDEYQDALDKGVKRGIELATQIAYRKVIENCNEGNLGAFTDAIKWEYNKKTNTGKVYVKSEGYNQNNGVVSDGMVIIINEFGSGIEGSATGYARQHGYEINMSKKGAIGWAFPTKDGEYRWTHGIPSKLMFYFAYEDIKRELGKYVNVSIDGTIGKLYEKQE